MLSNQAVPGEAQSLEEVGQLVLQLSQAGKDGDVMKLFAKHVSELVPGFTGVRYLKRLRCGSSCTSLGRADI